MGVKLKQLSGFTYRLMPFVPSVVFAVIAVWNGAPMSQDSVTYLSTANNIAAYGRALTYSGDPLTVFPLGFPAVYALGIWMGLDPQLIAQIGAITSVLATGLLSGVLVAQLHRGKSTTSVLILLVTTAPTVLRVLTPAWSEQLFIPLTVATVLLCVEAINPASRSPRLILLFAAMLASLATLARIVGVALVPMVVLTAWVAIPHRSILDRGMKSIGLGLVAGTSLLYYIARNTLLTGAQFIHAESASTSAIEEIRSLLIGLGQWFVPETWVTLSAIAGVLVFALLTLASWLSIRRRAAQWPAAVFVITYLALLLYSQMTRTMDHGTERMMAPLFVPGIVLVLSTVIPHRNVAVPRRALIVAVACAGLLLASNVARDMKYIARTAGAGLGVSDRATEASALVKFVRELTPDVGIAATDPFSLYLYSERDFIYAASPAAAYLPPQMRGQVIAELVERIRLCEVAYVLVSPYASSEDRLALLTTLEPLTNRKIRVENAEVLMVAPLECTRKSKAYNAINRSV